MAKETKAERELREFQEQAEAEIIARAEWPSRLMKNLERASTLEWTIGVQKEKFVVQYRDAYNDTSQAIFSLNPVGKFSVWDSSGCWNQMNTLESDLDAAEFSAAEKKRKELIRYNALLKLTQEEREELGLNGLR